MTVKYSRNTITEEFGEELRYPLIWLCGQGIEIAFSNRKQSGEARCLSFVNGIPTEGGVQVDALKKALVDVVGDIFYDIDICPSQILEGLCAVISISVKTSDEESEIYDFVYGFISKELPLHFKKNPETKWQLMSHFSEIAIWM